MGEREKERNCTAMMMENGEKEEKEMENFSSKNKSPLLCVHAMLRGERKERE
jgi:hypothetical protein